MRHADIGIRPQVFGKLAMAAVLSAAACSGPPSRVPIPPTVQTEPPAGIPQIIYRFTRPNILAHGSGPGALMALNGKLYGATAWGGATGHGTVFVIDPSGKNQRIIYSFKGSPDGGLPSQDAALIAFNGTLYGTTADGGLYGAGTVFGVTPDGKERVLHSFGAGTDGAIPGSYLTVRNGTLYGTTSYGGSFNRGGTVFAVTTDGGERVLHSFGSAANDAATQPQGGLVALNGKLYGVAEVTKHGWGTIFELNSSGSYRNVHEFSGRDGGPPAGGLTSLNGCLYGVTLGGYFQRSVYHRASAYEWRSPNAFRIVARLGDATGGSPENELTAFDGALYGVSSGGGGYRWGDVLEISTSASVRVVGAFDASAGRAPARLTVLNGSLFGSMQWGARSPGRDGTIYRVDL